ncbi:MAG: 1,4-dihydroxy-2-naphthoate polyprenyltransferase [Archangium sp.]|nr:1,4-dihydroxy-2-naphthoate polyprenyltransferase [Archangium sp.]
MSTAVAPPSALAAWALATRPRTLVAGVVPVAVGSALAFHSGAFKLLPALASLIGALFIQIGTNLVNDYFDFKRGADTTARLGPPRATQQGWLTPKAVFTGAMVCFALAFSVGLYLVTVSGWPLMVIGITSLLAGYAYTGGPFPLAYNGLGDVFVLVFFGFVAVNGTYFVQAGEVIPLGFICAIPVGLLGCALLAVNNTRDRKTDEAAGKKTLVVRFGERFGKLEYAFCLAVSALVPLALVLTGQTSAWVMLSWLAAPLAITPLKIVFTKTGAVLNEALAATAKLQMVFGILFAIGLAQ